MNDPTQMRNILIRLRQASGKSQAQVAEKIPVTTSASKVSRLESGDLRITVEDAQNLARAIGTNEAIEYADYLGQKWLVLNRPGFEHVNRQSLWQAEQALQQLKTLEEDPELKNVLLKQVQSCKDALFRTSRFLYNSEHSIALIGSPGVGKTTLICGLADLRNESDRDHGLENQMVLQTGGGRTTICEVHVRCGCEYAISVDPCTDEEMRQFVAEFCDCITKFASDTPSTLSESVGLSSEIDRALRNMTDLKMKSVKASDGKMHREDPAKTLAKEFPNKEDLQTQVFARLELNKRRRTSVSCPRDSGITGLQWLSQTFKLINYGRHLEFSLPRRIEVSIPDRILKENRMDIRLIDTRGVDEPKAPRRDLQAYLDDDTSVIVFCSSFKDSPDAAMLDVIERAIQGGLREKISERSVFVVLPQNGEESKVRDQEGNLAKNTEDGRMIKEEQIKGTFNRLGIPNLRVEFTDVTIPADCTRLQKTLLDIILTLRDQAAKRIESLVDTVNYLIANRENEAVRTAFEEVTRRIRIWTEANEAVPDGEPHVENTLLNDMDGLRYASSLRASVNRRGDWYNFDYWQGLGYGARCEAVFRTANQIKNLKAVITNLLNDTGLTVTHSFLKHLITEIDALTNDFFQNIQTIGETAFSDQLRKDNGYWLTCQNRWGGGSGYKMDIHKWTGDWFAESSRKERQQFIESELQRRWREVVQSIRSKVVSASPTETSTKAQ